MSRDRISLASRITLLTTVAVGLAAALVSVAAYVTVRVQLQHSLDDSLLQRARASASSPLVKSVTFNQQTSSVLGAADIRIALVSADGGVRAAASPGGSLQLGDPELAVAAGRIPDSVRTVTASDGVPYRVVAVPADNGIALVIAQSLAPVDRTLDRLGLVLLVVGLAGMVSAGLAGWAVARSGLRPVRRLTGAAEEVARTERLQPIEVVGSDEVARLATAFNAMLAALGASRDRQRQLVADAGHELRTPLTSLRTNLDLLAQADAEGGLTPQARAELLDDVHAQVGELSTLVGDLVELAREEPVTRAPEPLDLAEVVNRAVERVRRRAPGIHFDVTTAPWWVVGESLTLERAVTNLLDNAAKWSPEGGRVTVHLVDGLLSVADQGPGISDADLPHIFERFYRSSEARTQPGSGLGLAIVRQAAERHGGHVQAGRTPSGGAVFWLGLPGLPTEPPRPAAPPPGSASVQTVAPATSPDAASSGVEGSTRPV